MDIVHSKKQTALSKKVPFIIALVLLVTLSLFFILNTNSASYLAKKDSLLIDTVQRGTLNISVRGSGVLVPEDIRWITTNVPGRVERVFKRAGAKVQKGDLLLELEGLTLGI